MSRPTIGFAGMTHLGLNTAVATAARGFDVVGFDRSAELVGALRRGVLHVVEPGLDDLLTEHRERLRFTDDSSDLSACDVVYVAPDVPTDDGGTSDLAPVRDLVEEVARRLGEGAVMVVLSQVPPGFTRSQPLAGPRLFYQVETLIFGRAVERAMYPERFIVGCADPKQPLPPALAEYLGAFGCPILPMRYESAELAKISINMCLVASVSVANTMAEVCESVGADWGEITPALKLDRRIGAYSYLSPGLGLAGGNLERDLATVLDLAAEHGTDGRVVRAFVDNSQHRRNWAFKTLWTEVLSRFADPVVAVLGLAYKADTHSVKNSPSLALIERLGNYRVRMYDPVVSLDADRFPHAISAASEGDAVQGADVLVVMTPWAKFSSLDAADTARRMKRPLVIDPYAILDKDTWRAAGFHYLTLGSLPIKSQ